MQGQTKADERQRGAERSPAAVALRRAASAAAGLAATGALVHGPGGFAARGWPVPTTTHCSGGVPSSTHRAGLPRTPPWCESPFPSRLRGVLLDGSRVGGFPPRHPVAAPAQNRKVKYLFLLVSVLTNMPETSLPLLSPLLPLPACPAGWLSAPRRFLLPLVLRKNFYFPHQRRFCAAAPARHHQARCAHSSTEGFNNIAVSRETLPPVLAIFYSRS